MKIAFVTYRKQEKYSLGSPKDEDKVLMSLFKSKGLEVEEVIWNDPLVIGRVSKKQSLNHPGTSRIFYGVQRMAQSHGCTGH